MIARFLLLAGVAGASIIASSAQAQDASQTAPQSAADNSEQASSARGEVIIVTARRRAETAQEVPLAISVIRGDSIEATGNFNVVKLQQLAPTLQVYTTNPRNTSVNIRGLGVPFGLTSDGFEQGVGIYVDDVYNSRVAAATFDFLDVAQVEVLRGPQGTLYGKNTTAGAINITTNQPTFDFEGRAELTVGNLNYKQAKAAISGPLSETVAARIAVAATSRRGTLYNTRTQRWINEQDNLGIRGQLLFKPNEDLSITLSGDYSKQDPEGFGTAYVRVGTTQKALDRQYDALINRLNTSAQAAGLGPNHYSPPSRNVYDRLTDIDANLNAGNKIGGASARVKWDIGSGTFTSVTAWRFWDWKPENDRDFTGASVVSRSQNPSQQDQYSQEFRYNYSGDKVDFVVGLFGFKQRIDTQGTEQQGANASAWSLTAAQGRDNPAVLQGLTATNTQWLKSTSAALYGQLSYKLTPELTIQPGLRLNYDKKSGFYQRVVTDGAGAVVDCTPPLITNSVRAAQCGVYQPQTSPVSDSAWNFTYDFNVNYKVTRDILAYATYAKSFKTLGINQNGLPLNSTTNQPNFDAATVKPESVNHFEIGLKSTLFDGRATFNLTAFRTDIKNYQVTVNGGQFGTVRGYLANADKVRSQGIEADFKIRASDRFTVYANGAYTDAKYVKFCNAPPPPELGGGATTGIVVTGRCSYTGAIGAPRTPGTVSPPFVDISGADLPGVSKWAFSYGAEYNVPVTLLAKEGQVYLGVDGNYRSHWNSNATPSIYTNVKGYALTNFRAGFRGEGFDVFGWVRNAFDVNYIETLQVAPGNVGLIAGQPGDQRTWGGTIKFSF
ncbi:TonB-dependent receptor [Sphingobium chlorophenolicum]|nr:TonB-dependent receptor [Sphingobium chlorophenolicum]